MAAALVVAACGYLVMSPKSGLSDAKAALQQKGNELKNSQAALDLDKLVKSGQTALSKLFGNNTARSKCLWRKSWTIFLRSDSPGKKPFRRPYGMTSSIHFEPSKKLASSFLISTLT